MWFLAQDATDPVEVMKNLLRDNKLDWANWLIVRVLTRRQCLSYVIYATEQVIDIFAGRSPEDAQPRLALNAVRAVMASDTKLNRRAASCAAVNVAGYDDATYNATVYNAAVYNAASYAANAAYGYAYDAAYYAADATFYAVSNTYYAAYTANATDVSAVNAVRADAYNTAADASEQIYRKILSYGVGLLEAKP